ncbi:ornithine carbamoyltransferase [Leuconostoc citreum]|jgi:ornithine carbamoyltransferase|uniref:ornithine carbamoyltransferase n=1 Tax=Leuconostoc citreum TaxID=33964 RepID=UPI0002465C1C|nr:ornithine carbamoyltransferase [Leuconostoc citreum]MBA5938391.1 ornithine carbamoyltransferase [Leuconostoc citreum]MDU7281274.1 ornithine carbamoyltransferase [Leuconostoc citreum]QQE97673.1 ornithine carbamoyltransferase [Leuconostoc citreum]UVW15976.1 ornithine carbamoyltransferase [Leuconostoc citreum]CCF27236.1 Ornithine carbamoyltransferase [Leuconostoc citreum LBAE C11]
MSSHFQGKSFLKEIDFTKIELETLIDLAAHFKYLKQQHIPHQYLQGKNIALLFEKTSTRTRSSFTVAANDLGAHAEFLGQHDIQLGKKESLVDTAKVFGRMYDGIEYRGFSQKTVEDLATYSGVPVWNGLTDAWHPTQMLADFLTIKEKLGSLDGVTLAYMGDGRNNVAHSLLVTGAILGVNIHIVAPKSLQPNRDVQDIAQQKAAESGATLMITDDITAGVAGADVLYTDVWASMGEESAFAERIKCLLPYQINQALVSATGNPNVIVLHDLPAFHDLNTTVAQQIYEKYGLTEMEITDEIFNAPFAYQFDQAENRLHTIKAVMAATLGHMFLPIGY